MHPGGSIAELISLKRLLLLLLLMLLLLLVLLLLLPPPPRYAQVGGAQVCTTADREYAWEAWRLLDPTTSVLPHPLYH